ncbi:translin-like protein [Chloropicon primus]|uniref:Translin-like protein n=1 Tax=Chloropicon primus TaxID=1764295 RepID=A0A5B8MDI7_9CHLO|nr:translin-like protein [Chloropicon primus]UPQ97845.1 translin-like protein [Chloropicon primus]|eukprot:QDZ18636.1 translin-like protein [Chloropicon primus]
MLKGCMKRARDEEDGAKACVLDEEDFDRIRKDMKEYDQKRETLIKTSRDVQKLSKQAIFSLHRKDFDRARQQLDDAQGIAESLLPTVVAEPTLRQGSYSNALEEFAEAKIFQHYLEEGKLVASTGIKLVKNEEYLGGVLDFCGELNRFAVQRATARAEAEVRSCRDLVEEIMDQYLKFDFRNSQLRRKYDGLKYTLKNMETMLYELSLSKAGGDHLHGGGAAKKTKINDNDYKKGANKKIDDNDDDN